MAANVFREREFSEKLLRDQWLFALLAVSVMLMPFWFLTHAARERQSSANGWILTPWQRLRDCMTPWC